VKDLCIVADTVAVKVVSLVPKPDIRSSKTPIVFGVLHVIGFDLECSGPIGYAFFGKVKSEPVA
jgi:hypothetical protein